MKAFVDNNLSKQLAAGLIGFGEDVVHLKDIFQDDTPDADWLPYVGQNEMILVTRDIRIRWNPSEIASFKTHNLKCCQLWRQLYIDNQPVWHMFIVIFRARIRSFDLLLRWTDNEHRCAVKLVYHIIPQPKSTNGNRNQNLGNQRRKTRRC